MVWHGMMKVACIILLLIVLCASDRSADRDDWVEPHAWTRSKPLKKVPDASGDGVTDSCTCQACPPCPAAPEPSPFRSKPPTENHGEFLYRKLVNFMINEKRMKYDKVSESFHRTIHIELTREQYERLKDRDGDLRDIDGVLQDIWQQSKQGNLELMHEVLWSWSESAKDLWSELLSNRFLINTLQFGFIIAAYLWAKHRNLNVAVVAFAVTAFYVYRYLDGECHRKLDIQRIADLMQQNERNPCEEEDQSWVGYVFGGSRRDECIKFLESQSEKTCTIKDIYELFMQEFIMDSMSMFFETFARIATNIKGTYGYVGMIVALVLIYANVGVLISSIFKYVIGPIITGFRQPNPQRDVPIEKVGGHVDQLTPMFERLLTITETSTKLASTLSEKLQLKQIPSGVEMLESDSSMPPMIVAPIASTSAITPPVHTNHSSSSSVQSLPLPDSHSGDSSKSTFSSKCSSVAGVCESNGSTEDGSDRHSLEDWQGDTASEDDIVILEHFEETDFHRMANLSPENTK